MNGKVAYDYDRQQWVSGEPAAALRLTQLRETLALLQSERGAEYLRCIGEPAPLADVIAAVQEKIAAESKSAAHAEPRLARKQMMFRMVRAERAAEDLRARLRDAKPEWTFKIVKQYGEYQTRIYLNGKERKAARYFTDNRADAETTGRMECQRMNGAR